jgi:hypothetical protein
VDEVKPICQREKGKHAYDHIQMVGKGKGGTDASGDGIRGGISLYASNRHYEDDEVVRQWWKAYTVAHATSKILGGCLDGVTELRVSVLYEISKSPEEAWQALCRLANSAQEITVL